MKEKKRIFKNFVIIIITAIITCIVTTIVVYNVASAPKTIQSNNLLANIVNGIANTVTGINSDIEIGQKLDDINKKIKEIYIGEIDEKKMEESALEAYVAALGDEYTEYLTEKEVTALMENANGAYVGVGIYIASNTETNEILVIGVIEDSPASKYGIESGDIIKKIDGKEFKGEQLNEASNAMKGKEGTNVKITIDRKGEEIELDIVRESIKFKCISSKKLDNNVGYIKISSFDGGCAEDFEKAYKELEESGIKSLVIDLRNNGGGLVDESLKIAELIVPKGATMLITKDKKNNEELSVSKENPIINMPISILINGYTASASEILTAAIKENTNAQVVGTKSFGKGIIQGVFLFSERKTGLKITMQEYFTPKHNKLHKIGIMPDYIVELSDDEEERLILDNQEDIQLKKAIEIIK